MEYNVENLFDTTHDSLKADQEFLPTSTRKWDKNKFWKKLIHLSQVISSCAEDYIPDVIALCEVENDSCLYYLTKRSPLRVAGYDYLITNSPDERGIDIGFLYQRTAFKPIQHREFIIPLFETGNRPTRNIFHVTGIVQTGDTLDFFLCHFPSRRDGKKESETYRMAVAARLKGLVDSVQSKRVNPRIIITGDCNDEPTDKSLQEVLEAKSTDKNPKFLLLYNLITNKKPGTYKYNGDWNTLDQFIVNGNLLIPQKGHFYTSKEFVKIHQPPFLLKEDEKYGGMKPFKTYNGFRYQGGYSDHLPIIADFYW